MKHLLDFHGSGKLLGGLCSLDCVRPIHKKICATLAQALRGSSVAPEADTARAVAEKKFKQVKTQFKKAVESFKKRGLRGSARAEGARCRGYTY